jgi:hypothetical protein
MSRLASEGERREKRERGKRKRKESVRKSCYAAFLASNICTLFFCPQLTDY